MVLDPSSLIEPMLSGSISASSRRYSPSDRRPCRVSLTGTVAVDPEPQLVTSGQVGRGDHSSSSRIRFDVGFGRDGNPFRRYVPVGDSRTGLRDEGGADLHGRLEQTGVCQFNRTALGHIGYYWRHRIES